MINYSKIDERYIDEVGSDCMYLKHNKTGAKVLLLKNNDENKAFGIGFRTPPKNSTGVAHIVEHCVLSGSRKFKTKEPFMDLLKSSQQTFLNAMTFPDKTIYPVSSRNLKDFYNLMDVYLDSVLFPSIYEEEKIFLQEGIRLELQNKESEINYNGVVYNEMKGVYSSIENQVADGITFKLHENSTYGVDSGGDPSEIINLTYEEFLNFHRNYYHPSNSYIYLYGDLDMEKALVFIDQEYLSKFDYLEVDSSIITNESCPELNYATYSVSKEELRENTDYLAYSWVIGSSEDRLSIFMSLFLSDLLFESNSSPIKNALLEANLGEDIYSMTSSSKPLDLTVVVKNTNGDRVDEFKKIIEDEIKKMVEEGINKVALESTLNKYEFDLREGGGTQRAIIYYINSLSSWLYDGSPFDGLTFNETVKYLRKNIHTGYFENYLREKFIDNDFKMVSVITPEVDKNKKVEEEKRRFLNILKDGMTDSELDDLILKTKALTEYQTMEDTKEDKATIPSLQLEDISKDITHIPMEKLSIGENTLLFNPQFTNGITYVTFAFNMDHVPYEDLKYVRIISTLLEKVATKNYSYTELYDKVYLESGDISFSPTTFTDVEDTSIYYPKYGISIKYLNEKLEGAFEVLEEIIFNSIFEDKGRIKEVLLQYKSVYESGILQSGHRVVSQIVNSYFSEEAYYKEALSGMTYYFNLKEILEKYDENFEDLVDNIKRVYENLLTRDGLIVNITGDRENLELTITRIEEFLNRLRSFKTTKAVIEFTPSNKNEAYTTSSDVQFVSKGYDINLLEEEFSPTMTVLANILSSSYLHTMIRAKGGAYGAGVQIKSLGQILTYSYRDPNLLETVEVYDKMGDFVRELELSNEELKNFIIGSLNAFDPLLTPDEKGVVNLSRYITGNSKERLKAQRDIVLSTTLEDLKASAEILDRAMEKNYLAVIGNKEKIEENRELFKNIISIK